MYLKLDKLKPYCSFTDDLPRLVGKKLVFHVSGMLSRGGVLKVLKDTKFLLLIQKS